MKIKTFTINARQVNKEVNQDFLIIKTDKDNPVIIICDGHGDKKGKEFARIIGEIGLKSIPDDLQITKEYAEIIAMNFKNKIISIYPKLFQEYNRCGTTFLMVIFDVNYKKYIVVKLGDSYVINVPEDFNEDGSHLPYDTIRINDRFVNSMHPFKICNDYFALKGEDKTQLGDGIGWVNYCKIKFGANFGALGNFFRRQNHKIETMGIEPLLVYPNDNIEKCLDSFIKYDCLNVLDGEYVVVASDGLPIHKKEVWDCLKNERLEEWLKENYSNMGKYFDDCTVVVIYLN